MSSLTCRFCKAQLRQSFADLGMSPPSNAFLKAEALNEMETFFPLHAFVCTGCWLVQLPQYQTPDSIFSQYAYFSSFSDEWLEHAKRYVTTMIERYQFSERSQVVELGSNDGYLLRFFRERGVPVLGIEPAQNVAEVARQAGIPTLSKFFSLSTARELITSGKSADLIVINNVLAQIPELLDFMAGLKALLRPGGVITVEFPHLLQLMRQNQFDTIYHEHFSYFSLLTVEKIFAKFDLAIFDVEELPTHGGSLRIFAQHAGETSRRMSPRVTELRERETRAGLARLDAYTEFEEKVRATKRGLLEFLIEAKAQGKRIVGYGAPAKGNTLLNYCGVREDFVDFTVDRSPHKQGCYLPGTHIPIHSPSLINSAKPDYLLILPWNLKHEVMAQMAHIRDWGGKFVVPIPRLEVIP